MSHLCLNATSVSWALQTRPGLRGVVSHPPPPPPRPPPETNEGRAIARLKTQIGLAFGRAPVKYKAQEGDGQVLYLGLNPRDLSKLCAGTAPLAHLAKQLTYLSQQLLPHHKFSTITMRDSAGRDLHRDLRNSHYPQAIIGLTYFEGGSLWIESPRGSVPKEYMGAQIMGTCSELSHGMPLAFSGKRLLHCTQPWTGRRLVAVAFTLMGAFSIDLQLDQSLEALGFRVPDSLEVDFYTRELVGPGQPVQLQLRTIEHPHVWKAGTLKQGFPTTLVLSDSESENALRTEEGAQAPALDSSTACEEDTQAAMLTLSVHANAIGG